MQHLKFDDRIGQDHATHMILEACRDNSLFCSKWVGNYYVTFTRQTALDGTDEYVASVSDFHGRQVASAVVGLHNC